MFDSAGVQIFKYKLSSLTPDTGLPACIGAGAYSCALNTPSHFSAGCGAFQRNSPTGGLANGTPLKTARFCWAVPCSLPCATVTWVSGSALTAAVVAVNAAHKSRLSVAVFIIIPFKIALLLYPS